MRTHGYLAFILGMGLTLATCWYVAETQDRYIANNFQRDTEKIVRDTRGRLQAYFDTLLSVRGMIATGERVDRAQLRRFIGELNLAQRYPGFQAIQFARRVPAAELAGYVSRMQAEAAAEPGAAPFALHPQVRGADHFVIEFSDPARGNESVIGFDLASAQVHMRAIEMSADSGETVATGPLALFPDRAGQTGFVARTPVYRGDLPLHTVGQRRAALIGMIAIVFRVDDLMREVIDAAMLPHMAVQIYDDGLLRDGPSALPLAERELFDNTIVGTLAGQTLLPELRAQATLTVGQRRWSMRFAAYQGERYGRNGPVLAFIGAAGTVISTLIAALLTAWRRRRALAETLRVTLDEQRAFQDSATVGICLVARGAIVRCNRGLEAMLAYPPEGLTGRRSELLLPTEARFESDPFGCDGPARHRPVELPLLRRDGSPLWCMIHGKALDPDDPAKGCVWVIHDIGERKKTEAALVDARYGLEHSLAELAAQKAKVEQAHRDLSTVLVTLQQAQTNLITSEKMASLGSLVAGIAHELNTPIGNSLLTATALGDMVQQFEKTLAAGTLRRSALESHLADARRACAIIASSLGRAADLITSFKQVAVDRASDLRRSFELADVLRDTLATYAARLRRAQCEVRLELASGLGFESYPGGLEQVLGNLLDNALLHAFEGRADGRITIIARAADNGRVMLQFRDNGIGMSARVLHQVFDPFFTTKMGQGGSGLGMNIVYNIVTGMLGGAIDIESEPGEGTSVTLTIPQKVPEREPDARELLLAPGTA
ncbi:MAG: CHASE domain-containing protein [Pseudomonadota bacterium]